MDDRGVEAVLDDVVADLDGHVRAGEGVLLAQAAVDLVEHDLAERLSPIWNT